MTEDEGGHRQRGRATHHASQRLCDFAIRERLGSREVDHALEILVVQGPLERRQQIVERHPRPVLVAGAESAAEPGLERQRHRGQGTARSADDDPLARRHDADAGVPRRVRRLLPGSAHVGEEALTPWRLLVDRLIASRAVGTHRGRVDEDRGRRFHAGDRLRKRPRRLHAAAEDGLLATGSPDAEERDGREVDDGVDALQSAVVERSGGRIPGDLARTGLLVAHEPDDAMARSRQVVREVRPDEAARAGDRDLETRAVCPHCVPLEVQPRALVAEAEEAREGLAGRAFTDGVGEPAGRQTVLDVVEQLALVVAVGHEAVGVLPRRERTLELPVDELPPRDRADQSPRPSAA